MQVTMISNFFNHHQEPIAESFLAHNDVDFYFISTQEIPEERLKLGYKNYTRDFIVDYQACNKYAMKLINDSDIVIIGSAPYILLRDRLLNNKLTFVYSERLFKNALQGIKLLFSARWITNYRKVSKCSNVYALCASAYASEDFRKIGCFIGRTYKWGYFPETRWYSEFDGLYQKKKKNTILWVGRFIEWKHPDIVLKIANELKKMGYTFSIKMVGAGTMLKSLKDTAARMDLQAYVNICGSMTPEQVREEMEQSQIFLFTSDRNEGWGAVLNEAMNSGCTVVANSQAGSSCYLITDGSNGLLYDGKNYDVLLQKVKYVLDNPEKSRDMGEKAYYSITREWNAQNAVNRLIKLSNGLLSGKKEPLFEQGPCSRA